MGEGALSLKPKAQSKVPVYISGIILYSGPTIRLCLLSYIKRATTFMKKILLLFIFFPVLFSCKKGTVPASSSESQAIIIENGVLHYDNFPDG